MNAKASASAPSVTLEVDDIQSGALHPGRHRHARRGAGPRRQWYGLCRESDHWAARRVLSSRAKQPRKRRLGSRIGVQRAVSH